MSQLEQHFHVQASLALQLLKELPTETDEETHVEADNILSNFVRELGFTEIAEAYENIEKWYA
jgi:predicted GNAT family N-acyltransferase